MGSPGGRQLVLPVLPRGEDDALKTFSLSSRAGFTGPAQELGACQHLPAVLPRGEDGALKTSSLSSSFAADGSATAPLVGAHERGQIPNAISAGVQGEGLRPRSKSLSEGV